MRTTAKVLDKRDNQTVQALSVKGVAQVYLSLATSSWPPSMLFRHDGAEEAVCLIVKPCGEEKGVRVAGQTSVPER